MANPRATTGSEGGNCLAFQLGSALGSCLLPPTIIPGGEDDPKGSGECPQATSASPFRRPPSTPVRLSSAQPSGAGFEAGMPPGSEAVARPALFAAQPARLDAAETFRWEKPRQRRQHRASQPRPARSEAGRVRARVQSRLLPRARTRASKVPQKQHERGRGSPRNPSAAEQSSAAAAPRRGSCRLPAERTNRFLRQAALGSH